MHRSQVFRILQLQIEFSLLAFILVLVPHKVVLFRSLLCE